jgi:hypothetical protein
VAGEFEQLAYEAALRSLDKQERLVEELRARSGILLAASSVAASLLGQQAFQHPRPAVLIALTLAAFVISAGASIFILLPKKSLIFSETGTKLYEELHSVGDDMPEVYRRLTYSLTAFGNSNDEMIATLGRAFTFAANALVIEILALATLLGGSIF